MTLLRRIVVCLGPLLAIVLLGTSVARADNAFFPRWPSLLQTTVLKQYRTFRGELYLYVEDVPTGVRYTHNAATPAYIASGVKLPFMIELFRQVHQGKISLDEEITYTIDDVRDGSPVFNYVRVGTPVSLRVILEAMIQQSDNAASDIIARRVGIDRVNKGLKELGYHDFGPITTLLDVRRLVYRNVDERVNDLSAADIRAIGFAKGREARVLKISDLLGELPGTYTVPDVDEAFTRYYEQGWNSAPIEQVGVLLRDLALKRIISPQISQQMIEVMLGTMTGADRMTTYLPPGTPVAHKTGTQYRRVCDLGLIYVAKDHPVVFAACAKTARSQARAEEAIARVARRTYELLASPDRRAGLLDPIAADDGEPDPPDKRPVIEKKNGKKGTQTSTVSKSSKKRRSVKSKKSKKSAKKPVR